MKDENNLKQHNESPPKAKVVSLAELQSESRVGGKLLEGNYSIIADLKLDLEVSIGTAELTVKELFDLQVGSLVELQQSLDTLLTLKFDGKPIAYGTLVVVGDNFGIRIAEIVDTTTKVS